MITLQSRPWNSKLCEGDIVGTITRRDEVIYLMWRNGRIERIVLLVLAK